MNGERDKRHGILNHMINPKAKNFLIYFLLFTLHIEEYFKAPIDRFCIDHTGIFLH